MQSPSQTQSMSEDDAAYSVLLAQLLSDSAANRNARVHSWIEHQYDFALSEHADFPFASSRPPSPSPSSSLGAHRACSVDRPDSPLLPRPSADRTASPCPSYDALFFPHPGRAADPDFEEQERLRALRFIVQEMAHWKSTAVPPSPRAHDKPLPAPPPSPASSVTQSTSSRAVRSRSSSTCISRLPSFTSTLSSDQSQPQEMPPPLPVSVVVHGECQHDLVLRHDRPIVDAYLHKRGDSCPIHQEQDAQLLPPILDDKDSIQPSPTLSSFSCALSRETSFTTPYASSPTSPTSFVFSAPPCCPEDIALPASPLDDKPMFKDVAEPTSPARRPAFPHSSSHASLPITSVLSVATAPQTLGAPEQVQHLRAPGLVRTQSRWSVATTASLTPSNGDRKSTTLLSPKSIQEKKEKGSKTPRKRARFISLISRFSPGRNDTSSATTSQVADEAEYDSVIDSDNEDKEKNKPRKSLSKKSSLASLRASFSLSRASFSSQRPTMSSSFEEVPPLPTSPTLVSLPPVDNTILAETVPVFPKVPLSRVSSRANLLSGPLPPIPQSASTVTTFQSASQLSVSDMSVPSASQSRISLAYYPVTANASRISLLPASSKRTSLASAAGIDPMLSTSSAPAAPATTSRSKSIFRLTTKPKSIKAPMLSPTKGTTPTLSRLPSASHASLPSPTAAQSRIPQAPTKFTPPAKLASVIATQSRQIPAITGTGSGSQISKLPVLPTRIPPKIPRVVATLEKPAAEVVISVPPSSRLPMPASMKATRVGTVRGFWKRQ